MKKLILGIILVGAASMASAQKKEVDEAKKKWNIFEITLSQPEPVASDKAGPAVAPKNNNMRPAPTRRRSGRGGAPQSGSRPADAGAKKFATYVERQLDALYSGLKNTDNAIANEKSKDMSEAWTYRALFASSIALIDTLDMQNSLKHETMANEAIQKAKSLNPGEEEGEYIKIAESNLWIAVRNRGIAAYNRKDYPAAYEQFVLATEKNPNDTAMYANAALLAATLQKYPSAIANYKKAISLNSPDTKAHYAELMKIYLENVKDTANALAIVKEASEKYPDEMYYTTTEANIYIAKGEMQKAEVIMDKLLAKEPNNPMYIQVKANTYFNQAYELQEGIRKLEDQKKYKEADELIKKKADFLNKALPLYLKIETIDPKNAEIVKMIKQVYFSLGNNEKAAEYAKKQAELTNNN